MGVVFVTGMSGTGKSAALAELAGRGYRVVDTDIGGYSEEVPSTEAGGREQLWREDRIRALLDQHNDGVLFLSGCAPEDVILERVACRDTNMFGKVDAERERILRDLATVAPLLRAGATVEIDTRAPLGEVVDALERVAATVAGL